VQERVVGVLVGEDSQSYPMLAVAASNGAGGQQGERRGRWVRARCTARLGFKGGEGNRATTARGHPALTHCTASILDWRAPGALRRTSGQHRARMAARAGTPRGGGANFRDLGVLPTSGEVASGRREVALTLR
jgi:hypothetical protein